MTNLAQLRRKIEALKREGDTYSTETYWEQVGINRAIDEVLKIIDAETAG